MKTFSSREYVKQTVKNLWASDIKAVTVKYQFNFRYITFMRAVSRYSAIGVDK